MDVKLLHNQEIDSIVWDDFVSRSPEGMAYHLYEYLSTIAPHWQSILVFNDRKLAAVFPFAIRKKFGFEIGLQPFFTQYWGILIDEGKTGTYNKYENKKQIITAIHKALAKKRILLKYNFAPEFDYHQPLEWLGWKKKSLTTYWADINIPLDTILANMASHARREIKKAENAGINIKEEQNPEYIVDLLQRNKPQLSVAKRRAFYDSLIKVSNTLHAKGRSNCYIAYDGDKPIGGVIYLYYKEKMVYFQGTTESDYKNSGANSLIIWESIKRNHGKYKILDFDGSMIESIERFFRGFGAYPVTYCQFELNSFGTIAKIGLKAYKLIKSN